MTKSEAEAPIPAPRLEDIVQPKVLVRIVDARAPFPGLAVFAFSARPQVGDLLLLETAPGQSASYTVKFVNYVPQRDVQIDLGCLPTANSQDRNSNDTLRAAADDLVDRNVKIFDKASAYTNALIVAGYAGSFTIWSLYKDALTRKATTTIALLLGVSMLIFITWELSMMIVRTLEIRKIHERAEKPEDLITLAEEFRKIDRKHSARISGAWKFTLIPTIGLGYAGIILLMYNIVANLVGLSRWPE